MLSSEQRTSTKKRVLASLSSTQTMPALRPLLQQDGQLGEFEVAYRVWSHDVEVGASADVEAHFREAVSGQLLTLTARV